MSAPNDVGRYDADELATVAKLVGEALVYVAENYRNAGATPDPAWPDVVEYIVEHAPKSDVRDRYMRDLELG